MCNTTAGSTNYEKVLAVLQCACGHSLTAQGSAVRCEQCGAAYPISDGKIIFSPQTIGDVPDALDRLKSKLKKWNKLYRLLTKLISPVCPSGDTKRFIKSLSKESLILNLGSGNYRLRDDIVNMDMFPYKNVDVCGDISKLPFRDNSVDAVIILAVLEHVQDPAAVINEIYRVLKPSGHVFAYMPFIVGFHAVPYDYQRYTIEGMRYAFRTFDVSKLTNVGCVSGFLWVFQELLAILLSFGIMPLYRVLHLLIMAVTWPIKFLDLLYRRHKASSNITTGFYILGKKP